MALAGTLLQVTPAQAAPLAGPLLVKGQVSDTQGADGATVSVMAVPMQGEDGSIGTQEVLSSTVADAAGGYRLGLQPSPELLAAMDYNGGWLNVDVMVRTKSGAVKSTTLARKWTGTAWQGRGDRMDRSPQTALNFAIARDASGQPSEGAWQGEVPATSSVGSEIPLPSCAYQNDYISVDSTRIISFHNASNVRGKWEYGATADSDIDIGVQVGGSGAWTVSGSVHLGMSTSTTISGTTHNFYDSYVRTNFQYQHMHYINEYCSQPKNTYRIYARGWNAGISDDGKYPGQNCSGVANRAFLGAGQTLRRNSSRSSRISFAVGIGAARLGQTSGYSTNVDLFWDDVRNRGVFICGADGSSVTTAGVLYVSNL